MNPTLQYLDDLLDRYFLLDAQPKDEKILMLLSKLKKNKHFKDYDLKDSSRIPVKISDKLYNFKPSAFFKYYAKQSQPTCPEIFMPSLKPVFQIYQKINSDLGIYS